MKTVTIKLNVVLTPVGDDELPELDYLKDKLTDYVYKFVIKDKAHVQMVYVPPAES